MIDPPLDGLEALEGSYRLTVDVPSSLLWPVLRELGRVGIPDEAIVADLEREPHPALQSVSKTEMEGRNKNPRIWQSLTRIVRKNPELPVALDVSSDATPIFKGDLGYLIGWARVNKIQTTGLLFLQSILRRRAEAVMAGESEEPK